jgi:hypothetical protein
MVEHFGRDEFVLLRASECVRDNGDYPPRVDPAVLYSLAVSKKVTS